MGSQVLFLLSSTSEVNELDGSQVLFHLSSTSEVNELDGSQVLFLTPTLTFSDSQFLKNTRSIPLVICACSGQCICNLTVKGELCCAEENA